MKTYISLLFFVLFVCPTYAQIEMVDPTAELRREGTFIDTGAVALAHPEWVQNLIADKPAAGYFCFTEDRAHDIRHDDALPLSWLVRQKENWANFRGKAQPGETFIWQIGVFAPYEKLDNLKISFSDLRSTEGGLISSDSMTCYNLEGYDKDGVYFTKRVDVVYGKVQALWVGMEIPQTAAGTYTGTVTVQPVNAPETEIPVTIEVSGTVLTDGGVHDAWRKSRIKWINSGIGRDSKPTAPYIPLRYDHGIHFLGGHLVLGSNGLPQSINTHYTQANTLEEAANIQNNILAAPMTFVVETTQGIEQLHFAPVLYDSKEDGFAAWTASASNENMEINCRGSMWFDGNLKYEISVKARNDIEVKDIRLEIPYTNYAAKYVMGMGLKGGTAPKETFRWDWDTTKHQDQIWLGNVNAGLNVQFKDINYRRPLVNIYYEFGRLHNPDSWGNNGQGGVTITPQNGSTLLTANSGSRTLKAGDTGHYNFDLVITPVKPIDFGHHFTDRFYHLNADTTSGFIRTSLEYGANLINLHHKTDLYPFLNYPMHDDVVPDLKKFIDEAHRNNLGVRPYYTCRELSVKTPEFWILRSMGDEFLMDGPGNDARTLIHTEGPKPWLIENLRSHYIPGWYAAFVDGRFKGELDIAVIATPESRWSNYFLEGLDWMVKELEIDGIYIDDSSLDAETLRRGRRILDADGKRRLIDMHTWNHMNEYAGYANSIQLYMSLLPYVDRLWIGELFTADNPKDFWLVEMSGIPFGLMSETLDAHNIFKGMVFGMLPRLPWSGNPAPMWKLLDEFNITQAKMYGDWNEQNPFSVSQDAVAVTSYVTDNQIMLVVTNFDDENSISCRLTADRNIVAIDLKNAQLPEIDELQVAGQIDLTEPVTLPAGSGKIIILDRKAAN